MSGTDLVVKFLAEVAFRCFVWLIEKIASSQYAADVADALHSRFERMGAPAAAWSALRALPSAAGSRGTRLAYDIGFGTIRAMAIPLDLFGTVVFFATSFCVYYDAVAKPAFGAFKIVLLSHGAPLPMLIAIAVLPTIVLLTFAQTRAWTVRAAILICVGCGFSPLLFTTFGNGVRLLYPLAGTLASAAIVLILSSTVSWLLMKLSVAVAERGQEISRRIIGAMCVIVVVARAVMFCAHLSVGTAALELARGLAVRFDIATLSLLFAIASAEALPLFSKSQSRKSGNEPLADTSDTGAIVEVFDVVG